MGWVFLLVIGLAQPVQLKAGEGGGESPAGQAEGTSVQQQAVPQQPAFHKLRYEEDWSVLRGTLRDKQNEEFKFVPLNSQETAFVSFGGQVRLRGELWRDFAFGGPGSRNDEFGLMRVRLHSDLWLSPHFRVFLEGKSSLATSRELPGGLRTLDVDTADIQNLFVDINLMTDQASTTLRLGRQEMQLGKQRLVSPLDWANTRRTFDAARLVVKGGGWRIDGFWSEFTGVRKYSLNCADDTGIDFYGIYASRQGAAVNYDLYWLGYRRERAAWLSFTGEENRQTFGGRLGGIFADDQGFFDLEAALQTGTVGEAGVLAAMLAAQLGYTFRADSLAPRVYTGLDYGSGDEDPGDSDIGTFNQLFPLGHAYLGFIDIVGRQNIVDWSVGASIFPFPKTRFAADLHNFWRASETDALYNAGGGVVRVGGPGISRRVGSEIDLTISRPVNRHLLFTGGFSHFFTAGFLRESGPGEAINFLFGQIQATF